MLSATDFFGQVTSFGYDASGNLTSQRDPNGTTVTSSYDGDQNTSSITAATADTTQGSFSYTYDPANLVSSETDGGTGFSGVAPLSYTYTSTQRVATVNGAATSYTGAGSITGLESGAAQTYNAGSQITTSTPSGGAATTYGYNALGERTSATEPSTDVTNYGYNQAGDLTSFAPAADLPALSSTSYTYTVGGLLSTETDSLGTRRFTWDLTGSLPLMLTDGTNAYLYGPSGTPFEQVSLAADTEASSTFLVADAQGSVRLQVSDSGAVLGTVTYDANGNPSVTTGVLTTPVGYDGQWTDPDTQLVYLRARWLDPATAQFVSVDPMVSSTLQAYGYANENPLNSSDPTGLHDCNGNPFTWGGCTENAVQDAGHALRKHWRGVLTAVEISAAFACIGVSGGGCAFAVATVEVLINTGVNAEDNYGFGKKFWESEAVTVAVGAVGFGVGKAFEVLSGVDGFPAWQRALAKGTVASPEAVALFLERNA
jgi:RHS repeat-associated protein